MENTIYIIGAGVIGLLIGYIAKRNDRGYLQTIIKKLNQIIMTEQELLEKLQEADEQTNEIASDIADLLARPGTGISPEAAAKLNAHVDKLRGVASTHTPAGGTTQ